MGTENARLLQEVLLIQTQEMQTMQEMQIRINAKNCKLLKSPNREGKIDQYVNIVSDVGKKRVSVPCV